MERERCEFCGDETGRAGRYEDSLYLWDLCYRREVGPLCEDCYGSALASDLYAECE